MAVMHVAESTTEFHQQSKNTWTTTSYTTTEFFSHHLQNKKLKITDSYASLTVCETIFNPKFMHTIFIFIHPGLNHTGGCPNH